MPDQQNIASKRAIKTITVLASSSAFRRTYCAVFKASSLLPRAPFNIAFERVVLRNMSEVLV